MFQRFHRSPAQIAHKFSPARLQLLCAHRFATATAQRHQGHVRYSDDNFLVVCADDSPETEYYCPNENLNAANYKRARVNAQVAFDLEESAIREDEMVAVNVTGLNDEPLEFNLPNLAKDAERTKRLSSLGKSQRHRGVVIHYDEDKHCGMIIPVEAPYQPVKFYKKEVQSTGTEDVMPLSEVEFQVLPAAKDDFAYNITRPGGGLITTERHGKGVKRKLLGEKYSSASQRADIPKEFLGNRRRAHVVTYSRNGLYGYLMDDSEPGSLIFAHIDDAHMCGKRAFRSYQQVEYSPSQTEEGHARAVHISGPNQTVLSFNHPNTYLSFKESTKQLEPSKSKRYRGMVVKPTGREGAYGLIRPNDAGFNNIVYFYSGVTADGPYPNTQLLAGDAVEFSVELRETKTKTQVRNATKITMEGGVPTIDRRPFYGKKKEA